MKMYKRWLLGLQDKRTMRIFDEIYVPFLNMKKDAKDTFKPYKNTTQILRDLFRQVFYGIGNCIFGILYAVIAPFTFLFILITPLTLEPTKHVKDVFWETGKALLTSVINLLRGITQIASWPLTLLRIPVRGIITLIKGAPKIEDSQGLRKLVAKYEKTTEHDTQLNIISVLRVKFEKAINQRQKSITTKEAFDKAIEAAASQSFDYSTVIKLFKSGFEIRDQELSVSGGKLFSKRTS